VKVISFERSDSQYKYVVSAREGSSVAVLFKRRKFGQPQAEGGEVVGWPKAEEVQAFREASDWLTRFLHQDGSPKAGDSVFQGLLPSEPGPNPGIGEPPPQGP
jgi:hypothetical protein